MLGQSFGSRLARIVRRHDRVGSRPFEILALLVGTLPTVLVDMKTFSSSLVEGGTIPHLNSIGRPLVGHSHVLVCKRLKFTACVPHSAS